MIPGIVAGQAVGGAPPPVSYARFNRETGGSLSNDDRTLASSGGLAQCLSDYPVRGKVYLEYDVYLEDDSYSGFGCYGGDNPEAPDPSNPLGYWWGEPGASISTSQWTYLWSANYGMTEEMGGSSGASPTTMPRHDIMRIVVDESTRSAWVAVGAGAWWGGGDPAAGTSPTIILAGSDDIYVGADCEGSNTITMRLPDAYSYPAPSGCTAGIIVP